MALVQRNKMDMCQGPLMSKIIAFAIPLILTTVLQQLFHAADLVVIGRFASYQSMGAIGATAAICAMMAGMAYCVSSLPMPSVPNSVGTFFVVVLLINFVNSALWQQKRYTFVYTMRQCKNSHFF